MPAKKYTACVTALILLASALSAYLLPGEYILEKVAVHTQTVAGIYVKQNYVIYVPRNAAPETGTSSEPAPGFEKKNIKRVSLPEKSEPPDGMKPEDLIQPEDYEKQYCRLVRESELLIQAPDRLRLRVFGKPRIEPESCPCSMPELENFELLKHGDNAVIIKKESVKNSDEQDKWLFVNFLVAVKSEDLKRSMESLGVSLEDVRLALLEDKVAYMLGGNTESNAKVWLDKDSFFPLRALISNPGKEKSLRTDLVEYQYLDKQAMWYPAKINFYRGDEMTESCEMIKAVINPKLAADAFDESKIRKAFDNQAP